MITTKDLTAYGIKSQYTKTRPTIKCYKKIDGKFLMPCIYNRIQKEYKHVSFGNPKMVLRPDQEQVMKEFYNKLDKDKENATSCIFGHIYTGFGKTVIASFFAAQQQGPVLIFCDSDAVRQGWVKTWKEAFDVDVGFPEKGTLGEHDVCICTIQTAKRHSFSRDAYSYYKVIICDEADTLCTQKSVDCLLDVYPRIFLGLTATVQKSNGLDRALNILWGPRSEWIVRIKEFKKDHKMTINMIHTGIEVVERIRSKKLDWTAMVSVVSNNYDRNIMIRNICLMHFGRKILILTKTLDQIEILSDMFTEISLDHATYCRRSQSYYDSSIILATLSKGGRGYDDKRVATAYDGRRYDILILCITVRNADQPLGRALRGKTLQVYQMVDDCKSMKNHATKMAVTNSKRGATIKDHYF